ncbi:hypothetical protein [Pseudoalteromonas rubra]|uniref:hypothetical protein n=1 Tax=Pseudoalteromonas rubra TaxID=43658 RepID=UPI0011098FE7|nr:hypothetical protein [Pseudoalteromonas rubra]
MKLKLNKKNVKALSTDSAVLPGKMTPQVAGGLVTLECPSDWDRWTSGGCISTKCETYTCPPPHTVVGDCPVSWDCRFSKNGC